MSRSKPQQNSKLYKSNKNKISGTSFSEVRKQADKIFNLIRSKSKRTPYIRSKYFKSDKVFLNLFWAHIFDKNEGDRVRRLKFYDCVLDLIKNSTCNPNTYDNFYKKDELLHKFEGITKNNEKFIVQIKENKRSKRKYFISVYPKD